MILSTLLVPAALCATLGSAFPLVAEPTTSNRLSQALGADDGKSPEIRPAPKQLHGQFIHITDIHPDPWYIPKGRVSTSCHRKKPRREREKGGFWGAPRTETCDTPETLVNLTLQWLADEWADKVDFVIWTGDSARHDSDHMLPRSAEEIFDLNRQTVAKFERVFGSRNIPVVPCLGNNDMYPHNIMYPGPNEVTHEYLSIWKSFIPFPSYNVFQRGAYYSTEIIPNHLAAISLNTLYWYDSNKAVDGCPVDSDDPGRLQLDWLEVQLDLFRERKMQVWLVGHVPPTLGNYYQDCYLGYARLALRFQDTIVGHLFGHMNVDHFFWIDAHELHHPPPPPSVLQRVGSWLPFHSQPESELQKRYSLIKTLHDDFKSLPPAHRQNGTGHSVNLDDYVIVNVGPSVVPTYLPSVRIFRYNVTDYGKPRNDSKTGDHDEGGLPDAGQDQMVFELPEEDKDELKGEDDEEGPGDWDEDFEPDKKKKKGSKRKHGHRHDPDKIDCTLKKNRNKDRCVFKKPRHASKHSPSRTNTLWSPLGYTQFFLPDLDAYNSSHPPKYEIEYMTYPLSHLVPPTDWPIPQHLLPASLQNLTQVPSNMTSALVPYGMKDLTIKEWLKLARKLAKKKSLWKKFKLFMYLGGEED